MRNLISMKASICIATYNKPRLLANTLASIFSQSVSFDYEVIVVDDGSPETETEKVCNQYQLVYIRREKEGRKNPAIARNIAYKQARGEVIIAQSDDVTHASKNCIEELVVQLEEGRFVIATVLNVDETGKEIKDNYNLTYYTGPKNNRPLFFLGSLYRKDLYAVGGNDEEFIYPGREDVWFGLCLINGLGLTPHYSASIVGHHQHHVRNVPKDELRASHQVFNQKLAARVWCSYGGPWTVEEISNNLALKSSN